MEFNPRVRQNERQRLLKSNFRTIERELKALTTGVALLREAVDDDDTHEVSDIANTLQSPAEWVLCNLQLLMNAEDDSDAEWDEHWEEQDALFADLTVEDFLLLKEVE